MQTIQWKFSEDSKKDGYFSDDIPQVDVLLRICKYLRTAESFCILLLDRIYPVL